MATVVPLRPSSPTGAPRAEASWLARRLEQGRRDLAMVIQGLRGEHPPPYVVRPKPRPRPASVRPTLGLRELSVVEVERQTPDAVTLHLVDPTGAPIAFEAGQFLTLVLSLGEPGREREVRRAYSLSTDPADPSRVAVTAKRVAGGLVSNHLNDHARKGDVVRVLGPSGSFVVPPSASDDLLLIAGGSGITPIVSIIRHELGATGRRLHLVFGNRGEADILFRRALDELAARYPTRLFVHHVLSDPPEGWRGEVGLLEPSVLERVLARLDLSLASADAFLCGPAPMMEAAHVVLTARGVPASRIHEERFLSPHLRTAAVPRPSGPVLTSIRAGGVLRDVTVAPGQSLLEAGLAAGVKMPYSCAMGGCGACRVRLERGHIEMEEPNCLTPEERASGFVLACVGRPTEPSAVEIV